MYLVAAHRMCWHQGTRDRREERRKQQVHQTQEWTTKQILREDQEDQEVGSTTSDSTGSTRAARIELTLSKREKFEKEDDVVLPRELPERLTVQKCYSLRTLGSA